MLTPLVATGLNDLGKSMLLVSLDIERGDFRQWRVTKEWDKVLRQVLTLCRDVLSADRLKLLKIILCRHSKRISPDPT